MGKHVSFLTLRLLVLSIRRSSIPHTTAPRFCIFFNRTSSFSKSPSHTSCIVHDNCTHMQEHVSKLKLNQAYHFWRFHSQIHWERQTHEHPTFAQIMEYRLETWISINGNWFHLNSVSAGVCENQVVSGSRMLHTKMRACNPHEIWNAYPPSSRNILHLHLCYWCRQKISSSTLISTLPKGFQASSYIHSS